MVRMDNTNCSIFFNCIRIIFVNKLGGYNKMEVRCQALNCEGERCKNIARYKDHYHGDCEIYRRTNKPEEDIEWVEIFVCKKHLTIDIESENFIGKIKESDILIKR